MRRPLALASTPLLVVLTGVLAILTGCDRAPAWQDAPSFDPQSVEGQLGSVASALRAGEPERALQEAERLAALPEPPTGLSHYEGVALLDAGRVEEAVLALQREVDARPGNGVAHALMAEALLMLGRTEPVAEHLDAARRHARDLAHVDLLQGRLGLYTDDDARALAGFAAYLEHDRISPRAAEAHHALAQIATRRGQADVARMHEERSAYLEEVSQFLNRFNQALTDDPNDATATLGVGMVYLDLFQKFERDPELLDSAQAAFEAAVRIDPGVVKAHYNLGYIDILRERPEAARQRFEQTLVIEPTHVGARMNLALLDRRGGDPERALEHVRIAIRDAHDAEDRLRTRSELASLLEELGQRDEALEQYRSLLADFPDRAAPLQARIDALTGPEGG